MIRLVVKGPKKSAQRAAARRKLPVRCKKGDTGQPGSVICDAPCSVNRRALYTWYGEKAATRVGRGFPPGTLLYFTENCNMVVSQVAGARHRRKK